MIGLVVTFAAWLVAAIVFDALPGVILYPLERLVIPVQRVDADGNDRKQRSPPPAISLLPVQVADLVGQQEPIHRDVVKAARDPSGLLSRVAPKDQALLIGVVQETSELRMRRFTRRPGERSAN